MSADYQVSRKVGKAHVLPAPPAYSFGGKLERHIADPGPGPGSYSPGLGLGLPSPKGAGFGSSCRGGMRSNPSPGPGDYGTPRDPGGRNAAQFSIKGVTPKDAKVKLPGPGHYEPARADAVVRASAPAISMSLKNEDPGSKDKKPGPQEYAPDYRVKEPKGASLKFRHEPSNASAFTPGPGQYPLDSQRPDSEGKSFGVSRNYRYLDNGVPGPGHVVPSEDPVRPRRASYSFGSSGRDKLRAVYGPGPGSYVQDPVIPRHKGYDASSTHRSSTAFTFGGRAFQSTDHANPGPGDYGVPRDPGSRSYPAYTIKGVTAKDGKAKLPGPGHYEPARADAVVRASAPAISMSLKNEDPGSKDKKPGPQEYAPDYRVKEPKGASLKFRHEHPGDASKNPAPHDYADQYFKEFSMYGQQGGPKKGVTMGMRWRDDKREHVPGPQYNIGCSTLGIAASSVVSKLQMNLTVVL